MTSWGVMFLSGQPSRILTANANFVHSRIVNTHRHITVLMTLILGLGIASGCEDKRRHQSSAGIPYAATTQLGVEATPADLIRAFVVALAETQQVRVRGLGSKVNREAYDRAMGDLAELAAKREIHDAMLKSESRTLPANLSEQAALTIASESWVSMAAYYADGFLFETLQIPPAPANPGSLIDVWMEAVRPEDQARLTKIEKELLASGHSKSLGTPEYLNQLRYQSLAESPAFNVPIRAKFHFSLCYTNQGWRVKSLAIEHSMRPALLNPATIRSGEALAKPPAPTSTTPESSPPPLLTAPETPR